MKPTDENHEKRKRLKAYYAAHERASAEHKALEAAIYELWKRSSHRVPPPPPVRPNYPPFPDDLRGLTCGARTRAGTPCKQRAIWANGRCKFHGGLSTGPRTAEGKARSALNGHAPKRKRSP